MVLKAKTKIYDLSTGLSIRFPDGLRNDSQFPLIGGDLIELEIKGDEILIRKVDTVDTNVE